jgi:hypothetical protein
MTFLASPLPSSSIPATTASVIQFKSESAMRKSHASGNDRTSPASYNNSNVAMTTDGGVSSKYNKYNTSEVQSSSEIGEDNISVSNLKPLPSDRLIDMETTVIDEPFPSSGTIARHPSATQISLYSHHSFRLTEASEDDNEDHVNDLMISRKQYNTVDVVSDGLYYEYIPPSTDQLFNDTMPKSLVQPEFETQKSRNSLSSSIDIAPSFHSKRPPMKQDEELRKIKSDIDEKLKILD